MPLPYTRDTGRGREFGILMKWMGWLTFLMVSNLAVGLLFVPIVLPSIVICFVWIFGNLIKETIA